MKSKEHICNELLEAIPFEVDDALMDDIINPYVLDAMEEYANEVMAEKKRQRDVRYGFGSAVNVLTQRFLQSRSDFTDIIKDAHMDAEFRALLDDFLEVTDKLYLTIEKMKREDF